MNIYRIALALALVVSINYSTALAFDPDQGLKVHYTFDEIGTRYNDSSGNNIGAHSQGSVTSIEGVFGNAVSFSGDSSNVIFLHSRLNLGTAHSLSLWIKYKDDGDGVVLGKDALGYFLYIDQDNLYYNNGGESGADYVSIPHGGLPSDEWTHIVVVRDGTSVTFYKNGEALGDSLTTRTNTALGPITTIGRYGTGWVFSGGELFPTKMDLDDMRIYESALGPEEIAYIYDPNPVATNTPPRIYLNGSAEVDVYVGESFVDEGVTLEDDESPIEELVLATTTDPVGGVNTNATGTISLIYTVTDSGLLSASTTRLINIISNPNTGTSTPNDNSTTTPSDNSTSTPNNNSTSTPPTNEETSTTTEQVGGNSSDDNNSDKDKSVSRKKIGSRARSGGSVLGAFSFGGGQVLGAFTGPSFANSTITSCQAYLDGSLIGVGYENKADQVNKLKAFLNEYVGSNMPLDGKLDAETVYAVKKFQELFKSEIITPWYKAGLLKDEKPTGFVNKMTIRKINSIVCPTLSLPAPTL